MPKDKEPVEITKRRKSARRSASKKSIPAKQEELPRIPPEVMEQLREVLKKEIDAVGGQDSFAWRRFYQMLTEQVDDDQNKR